MGIRRNKEKHTQEPAPQGTTPHEIGLHGTVEDFHAALKAAEEDLAAKESAYQKSKTKYDTHDVFNGEKKYRADKQAYYAVKNIPSQLPKEFYEGACEAFLDGRPDNIQYIMSNPVEFYRSISSSYFNLDIETLVTLLNKSDAADTVPGIALAKLTEGEKQGILDRTLLEMVNQRTINESVVFALLEAGADASYNSNQIMAVALHRRAPDAVIDRLIERGADCDAALQLMYSSRSYGTTPHELTILKQAAQIRELQEAFAAFTGKPINKDAAPPAPAAPTRLKISPPAR